MLVLSRKVNETIKIDGPCEIMIVSIESGRVRIGINATPDVIATRGELGPLSDKKRQELKDKHAKAIAK